MNVLYVLGNGFDMAQNMATSYPEFYNHIRNNVTGGSRLLNQMKEDIDANQKCWSDMEMRLGEFTTNTDDADEFESFYFELNELLQSYLKDQEDMFMPTDKHRDKFLSDFSMVGKYLGSLDKNRFTDFIEKNRFSASKDASVITLNYTNTLEKFLRFSNPNMSTNIGASFYLRNIIHVHGLLGQSIIIGLDNVEQMLNEKFRDNEDVKDFMIKIQSNEVMKETRHRLCEDLINNAHLIILFGVSLGDTDARWWKIIGDNLVKRSNLAMIQHIYAPKSIVPTQLQRLGKLERTQQKCLMQKMRISEDDWTEELRNRLFFTINSSIFKA